MATKTLEGDDKSRKLFWKVANTSILQDNQADEQAPEGEYLTLLRDDKADVTPIGDVQYNIDLHSKVNVPRKTPERDNRDDNATFHVHRHVNTHEGSI